MGILNRDGRIYFFRIALRPEDFPIFLRRHRDRYPNTGAIEEVGSELIRNAFQPALTRDFVTRVCAWGGYAGIGARVLKKNRIDKIQAALRCAVTLSDKGKIFDSVAAIDDLKDLDLSFASKHLRFLRPEKAVVLDSVISKQLGYVRDKRGYEDFLDDCKNIASGLNDNSVKTGLPEGLWRPCNVEMALYAKLRSL